MPGPVFLRGDRVDLHTVEADDVPFLQRLVNDPRVRETLGSVLPYSERQQTAWFESLDPDSFAFLVRADGDPVGYVELEDYFPAWSNAEVVGFIDPERWGNGYASAAVELLASYAFDTLGLHRLYAHAQASNPGSRAVLERVGFGEEGRLRDHAYGGGERVDVLVYGLLAAEWRERGEREAATDG
jgi:RimJ/RimL family protein N-acetyltransferase